MSLPNGPVLSQQQKKNHVIQQKKGQVLYEYSDT